MILAFYCKIIYFQVKIVFLTLDYNYQNVSLKPPVPFKKRICYQDFKGNPVL